MPGHVKSSVMVVSLTIPIQNGKLALGTWQGIYLNEHRDTGGWGGGHTQSIVITLQGQSC
jgi:secondary thiamine-phosphate synthase enzyme